MINKIAIKYNFFSLVKYCFPAVMLLLVSSSYTVIDAMFVSSFVNSNALSAMNIVVPLDGFMVGVAVMLGTGGSALLGKLLGEERKKEANQNFSLINLTAIFIALVFTVLILANFKLVLSYLGASKILQPYCISYGWPIVLSALPYILQIMFNSLFITAGKPKLALIVSLISGFLNLSLDYLFIVPLKMGIAGAAWGTLISRLFGGLFPLFYFWKREYGLRFEKPVMRLPVILKVVTNGSSEMVSNIAASVITYLYNIEMMRLIGEDGVAAITIIQYTQFLYVAVFFGFANAVAPIISYNYGAKDHKYLQKLFRYCLTIITILTVGLMAISLTKCDTLLQFFISKGSRVYNLARRGYLLFIWNFIFAGLNIFSSSLFSAFGNGLISAIISFLRTFVFIIGAIVIFPLFIGIDGIWLSIPFAEIMTALIAIPLLIYYGRNVYSYLPKKRNKA